MDNTLYGCGVLGSILKSNLPVLSAQSNGYGGCDSGSCPTVRNQRFIMYL